MTKTGENSIEAHRGVAPTPEAANAHSELRTKFLKQRFFGSLDGLRAISILGVIWHHSAAPYFSESIPLVHAGHRGVNLFFVISAFLISTLLIRAKDRGALNVPRFWIRRALRILPLYYAMLLLYVGLAAFAEHDGGARSAFFGHLKYFATFTSNWFVDLDRPRVIFFFAWSLAAEEQFYVCWPWVERALRGFRPALFAAGALVVTQGARFLYELGGRETFGLKIAGSVPAAILVGVVLAHALHTRRGFHLLATFAARRGSAAVAALAALGALAVEPYLGLWGETFLACILALLVATCVIREDNDLAVLLRWKPIAWIGTVSYGVYLMNTLGITVARSAVTRFHPGDAPWLLFAMGSAIAIVAASLSYITYERFFLRIKDRWFGEKAKAASRDVPLASAVASTSSGAAPL